MSEDLRLYRTMVLEAMSRALSSGNPEVFQNSGKGHARVVIDVMLEKATSTVDIIAGQMHKEVWSADSLRAFLRRNPKGLIRVMLEGGCVRTIPESSALLALRDEKRVEIRWMARSLPRHFCVIDRSHVRLEYDKGSREASITFGDPDGAGAQAAQIFENLWTSAPVLQERRAA